MTWRERYLFGLAVEACGKHEWSLRVFSPLMGSGQWAVEAWHAGSPMHVIQAPSAIGPFTLTEALTALLAALGVEVDWPSPDRVAALRQDLWDAIDSVDAGRGTGEATAEVVENLRGADPFLAAALLDGTP